MLPEHVWFCQLCWHKGVVRRNLKVGEAVENSFEMYRLAEVFPITPSLQPVDMSGSRVGSIWNNGVELEIVTHKPRFQTRTEIYQLPD